MINKFNNRNIDYENIFNKSIVLIGPVAAGKSTISEIIQRQKNELGLVHMPLDKTSEFYLNYYGYDFSKGRNLMKSGSYQEYLNYRQLFNFQYIKSLIDNIDRPYLLEFGGSDTITSTNEDSEELKSMLREFKNVVLLLPSKDKKYSEQILERRVTHLVDESMGKFLKFVNRQLLQDGFYEEVVTSTVYTESKTPEEVAYEILELVKNKNHKM